MKRTNISTNTKWEPFVGYSRAVKKGPFVYVSGTTAVDENGQLIGKGDAYLQTKAILEKIGNALNSTGAEFSDVVRTRMYVTDISLWEDVGRAHGEVFRDIRPASTMVEIKALVDPDMLVEIEAEATINEEV